MTQHRQDRLDRLHKLAVILYRHNKGISTGDIARDLHYSKAYVYQQLMRASHNVDVKYEAALMAVGGERQMMFEFMYEPH